MKSYQSKQCELKIWPSSTSLYLSVRFLSIKYWKSYHFYCLYYLTKIRWRTKPCCSLVWSFFMVNYSCVIIIRFNFSPVARWQICQKCYSRNKYYQSSEICLFIWPIFRITSATSLVNVIKNVMFIVFAYRVFFYVISLVAHFRETWP